MLSNDSTGLKLIRFPLALRNSGRALVEIVWRAWLLLLLWSFQISTGALSVVVLVPAFAFSQTRKLPDTPPGAGCASATDAPAARSAAMAAAARIQVQREPRRTGSGRRTPIGVPPWAPRGAGDRRYLA